MTMPPRADYGGSASSIGGGAVVASVEPGGAAQRSGMSAGDKILAADGHVLRDVIDWQWTADGASVDLDVVKADGTELDLRLMREQGETWGFDFESVLFDGVRTCRNNCTFCFMAQLPKGLRRSLYLRDDDFRLSFLQGNFVTLTNLEEEDVERIESQRLSPLYVSLHAADPEVREKLICAREDRALERFDQLLEAGIELHVQIVLVPGVNDGERLDETLTWLAEREGVVSVGIVPLGYTGHQGSFTRSYNDALAAATVIQQVQRWQFESKERDGVSWVHLADEFYLNARAPFPTAEWYDGFPQYENGIGLVRTFVDEATAQRKRFEKAISKLPAEKEAVTLITGVMAATTLAGALQAFGGVGRIRLLCVPNRFFGGNVSVTGLLAGADIAEGIEHDVAARRAARIAKAVGSNPSDVRSSSREIYLLPDVVLNADGLTLDDMTLAELRDRTGAEVRLVSSDAAGLLRGLEDSAADLASGRVEE